MKEQFAKDVLVGLTSNPKKLSSKYFYDKKGDELFIEIMNLPEYYLTNSEMEILSEQSGDIVKSMSLNGDYFEVFELGAGDGTKTIKFLEVLKGKSFKYVPVDISENAINLIESNFKPYNSWLKTDGLVGDYFNILKEVNKSTNKIVLFLGSNLGNMDDEKATGFLNLLSNAMNAGDYLLLGLDLKKDKAVIAPAYNDSKGVTAAFNLNLLTRINRELGADFNLTDFAHSPLYDDEKGIAYSFIKPTKAQEVNISKLNKKINFSKGELIHTEISRKYNTEILNSILEPTDLVLQDQFLDQKKYFANFLIQKK